MPDLTVTQAMARLGVSRRWLLHLVNAGRLPASLDAAAVARYRAESAKRPNRSDDTRRTLRARMRRGDT